LWEGTAVRSLVRILDTISAIWHKSTPDCVESNSYTLGLVAFYFVGPIYSFW